MRALGVAAWVALAATAGCSVSAEAFPKAFGRAVCDRLQTCDESTYQNLYDGDRADCLDDGEDLGEELVAWGDEFDCDWDAKEAAACLAAYRSEPCGNDGTTEIADACEDVYDCSD